MKRTGGFTPPGKQLVLRRIQEIRNECTSKTGLSRKLKIPFTGKKIHYETVPIMEFRDKEGTRRFFRSKDQLRIASIATLKSLHAKVNKYDSDEARFYRIL